MGAKQSLTVRLPGELVESLKLRATVDEVTQTEIVERALVRELDSPAVEEAPAVEAPSSGEPSEDFASVPDEQLALAVAALTGKPISLCRMFVREGRVERTDRGLILLDGAPAVKAA